MGWTKRQFIDQAFSAIGMGYCSQEAESVQTALAFLDSMVAEWTNDRVQIGWPITDDPDAADVDATTEVESSANFAIWGNLATLLADWKGKQVPAAIATRAANALSDLKLKHAYIPPTRISSMCPLGSGNKRWGGEREFFPDPGLRTPDNVDETFK